MKALTLAILAFCCTSAAVPALIQRLAAQPESNFVFDSVVYALANIGPGAAAAIPTSRK
jgi:hypothetical protein